MIRISTRPPITPPAMAALGTVLVVEIGAETPDVCDGFTSIEGSLFGVLDEANAPWDVAEDIDNILVS
jgi:hypothetical protein